jgi:hypothetical protein
VGLLHPAESEVTESEVQIDRCHRVVGGVDSRSGVETATNGEGDDDDAVHNAPTGGTVAGLKGRLENVGT